MLGLFRDKTKAEAFYFFHYGYSGDTIILGMKKNGKRVQEFTLVVP